jgi:SAM-dependent methyltransferase
VTRLTAELYALTHRGNAGDLRFYAEACRKARSVLELGTGFGRMLPTLARASPRVTGLELDRELLTLAAEAVRALPSAQRERLTLVHGDMQDFALHQRFDRIVLPYNGLYCLLTRRALLQCFRCVRAHLAPGGLFVADVWAADTFHRTAHSPGYRDDTSPILSFSRGKEIWDVFERSRLRRREQRLDVTYTYGSRGRARSIEIRIEQRYLRFPELRELLGRAGLELVTVHGDFSGSSRTARSEHVVFAARSAVGE